MIFFNKEFFIWNGSYSEPLSVKEIALGYPVLVTHEFINPEELFKPKKLKIFKRLLLLTE